jgi:putative hydrolase of the HAD superfamily
MSVGGRRFDAVIFDLDGTLLVDDEHSAVVAACDELATLHPAIDAEALVAANADAWREYWPAVGDDWMLGRIANSEAVSSETWSRSLARIGVANPAVLADLVRLHSLAMTRHRHPVDGAQAVIDAARATGAKLGIVTNGALDMQTRKLAELGFLDQFDVVTTSGGAGVMKPDARIFILTLEALGVPASRALHIGDNLVSDVGGAKAAGLSAVWINLHGVDPDAGVAAPDHEVRALADAAALLG